MAKILVVDDNRTNVALYHQVLSALGVDLVCYTDPQNALRWCQWELPVLLVVDYRMPDMDGVQFIRRFRKIRGAESIPIVMLTAISSPVLWQMALDAGANAFLLKPIDKRRFLATVAQFIPGDVIESALSESL